MEAGEAGFRRDRQCRSFPTGSIEPDCANGFILDGYPRTLRRRMRLKRCSPGRAMGLDAVIELVVDDKALGGPDCQAAEEAKAAGQPVRKDDTPEVFDERLRAYYKKTAPLTGYYYAKGMLKTVDGMDTIEGVTVPDREDSSGSLGYIRDRLRLH
jgi:adenylate kinase